MILSILIGSVVAIVVVMVWIVIPIWRGGAFWVPAYHDVVRTMLTLAKIKPGELVIDLGSGDGRIPLVAAREFGAQAVGVEINFFLVWLAKLKALFSGDKDVTFAWQDLWRADVSQADIVTLFLYDKSTILVGDKLLAECKPSVRVVSYLWKLGRGWKIVEADYSDRVWVYKKEAVLAKDIRPV